MCSLKVSDWISDVCGGVATTDFYVDTFWHEFAKKNVL